MTRWLHFVLNRAMEKKWTGINAKEGKISDMLAQNIVEPVVVKQQIIKSATETASMILRIDDVIAISGAPRGGGMPPKR